MSEINKVFIKGIAANVPKNRVDNLAVQGDELAKMEKTVKGIGVRYRYMSESGECTSDLCYAAAMRLISESGIDINEIGLVLLVTQSADHILPATSCILQHRLGLPEDVMAFDVNLGCSGYVYGLQIASSILQNTGKRFALLLAGDTSSEHISKQDQSAVYLFGDAGTATLIEKGNDSNSMRFDFRTMGSGAKHLIIQAGASRHPIRAESLIPRLREDGNIRADNQLFMDGMEIFNFAISTVVDGLKEFMAPIDEYDAVVFHQANFFMLESMRKMLKIPKDKFLYSLQEYGNTSSASIPMTICKHNPGTNLNARYLLTGFGVGLSVGYADVFFKDTMILGIEEGSDGNQPG